MQEVGVVIPRGEIKEMSLSQIGGLLPVTSLDFVIVAGQEVLLAGSPCKISGVGTVILCSQGRVPT